MSEARALLDPVALQRRDVLRTRRSIGYVALVGASGALVALLTLGVFVYIIARGLPAVSWEFVSALPRDGMTAGGIWPMIRGSLLLMAGTLLLVLPIGVFGGLFLAEYAGRSRLLASVRGLVTSLAGTPSIVYGLFGFAVFVLMFGKQTSLVAGCLTLTLMAVPVVVLATEAAVRSVPDALIDGGYALGMTRWQVMRRIVLPNALPGIMTGVVLASGRAAGEAPPILLTAGIFYQTEAPTWGWHVFREPVANLPYHLAEGYRQGTTIPERIIWGTCLVLIVFVLLFNLGALVLRARARRHLRA